MLFVDRPVPPLLEAIGSLREGALARAPQAEWGLAHQGAAVLLSGDGSNGWLVKRAGRSLVALGMPLGPVSLDDFAVTASARFLSPLLYKCDAATAAAARRQGWSVLRLGSEAVLDLRSWSVERPACRQLRRKLRGFGKDLRIEVADHLPLLAMEEVARDWARRMGGERGFSMGRVDPQLLRHQRVLLAWRGDALLAFASFHVNRQEWTLDLMRQTEAAPSGTMHGLVVEGIAQACVAGALRLSLAGLPARPRLPFRRACAPCGLTQFKLSFGPRLLPRYAAAPNGASLAAGLAQVAWAIHRPGPLSTEALAIPARRPRLSRRRPENFGFEPATVPCDAPPATVPLPQRSRLT